jgi:trans-2,3-dihydro-3-hydroxyanthranilate isomerase
MRASTDNVDGGKWPLLFLWSMHSVNKPFLLDSSMQKRLIRQVNAFTKTPFSGNPAGVVPEADGLTDAQMQHIAREMNCSETAFVLTPKNPEADLKIRWFTPATEVALCGHATVATFHVLSEEERYRLGPGASQILYLETEQVGSLPITVDARGPRPQIWMTLPTPKFVALTEQQVQALLPNLGLEPSDLLAIPVVVDQDQDVLLGVKDLKLLHQIKPPMSELKAYSLAHNFRGIDVFTTQTLDPGNDAHARFFGPAVGIDEDPVTGSVSGPLACWLREQGLVKKSMVTLEQGDILHRPGRVLVDLSIAQPRIGGEAVTVMRGDLVF